MFMVNTLIKIDMKNAMKSQNLENGYKLIEGNSCFEGEK